MLNYAPMVDMALTGIHVHKYLPMKNQFDWGGGGGGGVTTPWPLWYIAMALEVHKYLAMEICLISQN